MQKFFYPPNMKLTKEYTYNTNKPVLLVCDYYETSHIPIEMVEIKDNIALFPIANIPLIEIILTNLLNQKYTNIIIGGTRIEKVVEHVMNSRFASLMDIKIFQSKGSSLGDLFREFYQHEFEFKNLLVLYANSFTNVSLKNFRKKHKKHKNNLLSIFTHPKESNDLNVHVYGTVKDEIIFYDKIANNVIDSPEIISALYKRLTVQIDTSSSSPTTAFVSNEVFSIFTENFDFHTFGDLIVGILATKLYEQPFHVYRQCDLMDAPLFPREQDGSDVINEAFNHFLNGNGCNDMPNTCCPENNCSFYGREIVTLLDYYNFNKDLAANPEILNDGYKISIVKSEIRNNEICICDSFVGEFSLIEASIKNCIVWDNCTVIKDSTENIYVSDKYIFDINYLETAEKENIVETPNSENVKQTGTFFDDLKEYLLGLIATAKFSNFGQTEVHKQISLLRIVWNASQQEVVEAFAYFFIDIIDINSLEGSLSKASNFFGLFSYYLKEKKDQELLLEVMYDCLSNFSQEMKIQIFFNYGYLFVQDQIIDKSVLKKYSKLYKAGKL